VWLSKQDPAALDHTAKYHSCCTALGRAYVTQVKAKLDPTLADQLHKKLVELAQKFEVEQYNN
jgi:hypothetical protein